MMIRFALTLVVGLMLSVSGSAWGTTNTSSLLACPSNQNACKHNCFGTFNFSNGDEYVGEWRDGQRTRQGTYTTTDRNIRSIRDA